MFSTRHSFFSFFFTATLVLAGCGSGSPPSQCKPGCGQGQTRCEGEAVQVCQLAGDDVCSARWVAQQTCDGTTQVCREGACAAVSAQQREWSSTIAEVIDTIETYTGLAPELDVDVATLKRELEQQIFHAPETRRAFFSALRQALLRYPSGHLAAYVEDVCGLPDHPYESASLIGACTQPYGDHAVVSYVRGKNLLGLVPGDEILAIDGKVGQAMLDAALEQPLCGGSVASASHRRYVAATSLFAAPPAGTRVKVRHLDGATEEKVIDATTQMLSCRDPFGRAVQGIATSHLRPDGVGVIVVPRLHLGAQQTSLPLDELLAQIRAQLRAALDAVQGAPAIVWDLRANEGGSSLNGLEIVAGTSGAQLGKEVGAYTNRHPGSDTFTAREAYVLAASTALPYSGKVAMLTDGLTISAGDYTARAARVAAAILLVGAPPAGAYGGGGGGIPVGSGTYQVVVSPDAARGEDETGQALEGKAAEPHVLVELTPQDLAAGRDTVLERAVAELLK